MRTAALIFILAGLFAAPVHAGSTALTAATVAASNKSYEDGRRALDRGEWQQAREAFDRAAKSGTNVDGALYWKAYAEMKLKDYPASKETIARLRAAYPQSRWAKDAHALELEMRGPRGDALPEDEEMKLYALQMLMMNNPERAEPLLKKYIEEGKSDELREKAMFILLQHPDAAGSDVLNSALSQATNIPLKISAVRLLGMLGDDKSRELLDQAYRESNESAVKHMIIQSYMMQKNGERLAEIIRTETDAGLKRQAVTMLGVIGEIGRVRDLYNTTDDTGIRRAMMQGFAMAGEGEMLLDVLEKETDPEVRMAAVNHLMMVDAPNLGDRLSRIYDNSRSAKEKTGVIRAMAMRGESESLIAIYRKETDTKVRREILQSMALFMNDARVADFFEDVLQEKN